MRTDAVWQHVGGRWLACAELWYVGATQRPAGTLPCAARRRPLRRHADVARGCVRR